MIQNKDDLKNYIKKDRDAILNGGNDSFFKRRGKIRKFYIMLRRSEYYSNTKNTFFKKIMHFWYHYRYRSLGLKLNWDVPENVLGAGARIMHPGTVIINGASKIGPDCKIHACVNIGASAGNKEAPQIGKHVYIGPGAKIFGDIIIADNIAIGANAVVNKSFLEPGITIAGIPAQKISDKGFNF